MRFFSRSQASELARAGRRPHGHARGNGWEQRLLAAALAAVEAAVSALGVGGEVGRRQVAGATGLATEGGPPPRQRPTGWRGLRVGGVLGVA